MSDLDLTGTMNREHSNCCVVRSMSESGCSLRFPSRDAEWVALSGTRYARAHQFTDKLCDIMFAWNLGGSTIVSAVFELKSTAVDVGAIQKQLQNGASILEGSWSGPRNKVPAFRPVLVHRGSKTINIRALRKLTVSFAGKKLPIGIMRCGEAVTQELWT